jgi:glyoxylase-like metal-dependent hydrolase (beta-lactamase superfamily II)
MKRALVLLFSIALLSCATGPSREQSLVQRAAEAMGGLKALSDVRTVQARATVRQWEPEQSDVPGGEMRFANEAKVIYFQDRDRQATRTEYVRNFAYPAPRTFTFSEITNAGAGYVIGIDSNGRNAENLKATPPAHAMSGYRLATSQREIRRSSAGDLIAAMSGNAAKVRPAADIVAGGQTYPAVAYEEFIVAFDPQTGLPARVRTLDYDNVWGDVTFDEVFEQWREIGGGIKAPAVRKSELNGRVVAETSFSEARINSTIDPSLFEIPAAVRANAPKAAAGSVPHQWVLRRQFIGIYMDSDNVSYDARGSQGLRLQDVAPGVSLTQGGTHNSLIVEMRDHLVVFDSPVTDAQSVWVVNAAKAKYPGKPIRYLVLTHHHMDHTGGMRGFLAEGATLVVGQGAGAHYRRVLAAPWTRNPDLKARDLSGVQIVEVADRHVLSDGTRQVQAILMDSPHAKSSLMGYVEDARLGFVTDIWSPGVPLPGKPNPGLVAVVNAVKKANIQPERFAGGHGATANYSTLTLLVGQ